MGLVTKEMYTFVLELETDDLPISERCVIEGSGCGTE